MYILRMQFGTTLIARHIQLRDNAFFLTRNRTQSAAVPSKIFAPMPV